MAIVKHTLSFAAGELSPWLDGRGDISKYDGGCRVLENFIPLPQGSLQKRPGMEHLAMAEGAMTAGRLIDFQVSTTEAVMLVLGDGKLAVWRQGAGAAPVEDGEAAAILIDIPWSDAELPLLRWKQINSVIYFTHPAHAPRKLTRYAADDYELVEVDYSKRPALLPENLKPEHTIAVEDGAVLWAIGLVFTTGQKTRYKGSVYTSINDHTAATGNAPDGAMPAWTSGVLAWTAGRAYVAGQLVTYPTSGRTWKCQKAHTAVAGQPPTTATYQASIDVGGRVAQTVTRRLWIESFSDQSVPAGGVVNLTAALDTWQAGHVGSIWELAKKRASNNYEVRLKIPNTTTNSPAISNPIVIQGGWNILTTGNWRGTWYVEKSTDGQEWEELRSWVGENDRNIDADGEEEERCLLRLRWVRSSSAANNGVDADVAGILSSTDAKIRGLVRITAVSDERHAVAEVVTPVEEATTYFWSESAWNEVQGYPRVVELHQSRMVMAATGLKPHTVWGSASDDYENFYPGTKADEAFRHTIAIGEKDPILWLVSDRSLLVGTGSGEFAMWGADKESSITAEAGNAFRQSSHGCHNGGVPAVFTDSTTLFVQRGGTRVREFSYRYESDRFEAPNLNILADHLFTAAVGDIAIQRMPWQVIWFVSGGKLYGLTYEPKQEVVAWHRHPTEGTVLAVATVRGTGEEDEVWFLVERGAGVSIERFRPGHMVAEPPDDGWWTDGAVECAVDDLSAAAHLDGKSVWGFVSRNAYQDDDFNSEGGWSFTTYARLSGSDVLDAMGFFRFAGLRHGKPWYEAVDSDKIYVQWVPAFDAGEDAWVLYVSSAPVLVCFDGGDTPLDQEWRVMAGGPSDAQFTGQSSKPGDDLGVVTNNNPLYAGIWERNGTANGRPAYGDALQVLWTGAAWEFDTYWYSTDDVATPDLVTTWLANPGSEGQAPVFTRTVAEGEAETVVIGIPYTAAVKPMTPEIALANGSSRSRELRAHRIVFSLRASRGGKFGEDPAGDLDPLDAGSADELLTGEIEREFPGGHGTGGDFCVVSDEPYPFAVRTIALKCDVYGDT
jgi:hypothetical protein